MLVAENLLGDACALGGVFGVVVGADLLCVFGREHGASDDDLDVGHLGVKQLDGLFHGGDRGGHKRRETHKLDIAFAHAVEHRLRVHIATQVEYRVAVVVEQHLDDVLADVVDIALDGGDADLSESGVSVSAGRL